MKPAMLKLLLITATTTALDHYARTVPAVVDRVRAAQVTADACDTFAPCAAPVLADAADTDAALASLRTHGYAIVESPGLAERWLDGARAMTADDQLRGVWGSTAAAGRPDTLYGGYGGRTAVYVDIRWDERGRTLPRDCGAAAPPRDMESELWPAMSGRGGATEAPMWSPKSDPADERGSPGTDGAFLRAACAPLPRV